MILTRIDCHLNAECIVKRVLDDKDDSKSKCYEIVKVISGELMPVYGVGSKVFLDSNDIKIML